MGNIKLVSGTNTLIEPSKNITLNPTKDIFGTCVKSIDLGGANVTFGERGWRPWDYYYDADPKTGQSFSSETGIVSALRSVTNAKVMNTNMDNRFSYFPLLNTVNLDYTNVTSAVRSFYADCYTTSHGETVMGPETYYYNNSGTLVSCTGQNILLRDTIFLTNLNNLVDGTGMFGCQRFVKSISGIINGTLPNLTYGIDMFGGCESLEYPSVFVLPVLETASNMFGNCRNITHIYGKTSDNLDSNNKYVTKLSRGWSMCINCRSLNTFAFFDWTNCSDDDGRYAWLYCPELTSWAVTGLHGTIDMRDCPNITNYWIIVNLQTAATTGTNKIIFNSALSSNANCTNWRTKGWTVEFADANPM